jgi:hypothetical protein
MKIAADTRADRTAAEHWSKNHDDSRIVSISLGPRSFAMRYEGQPANVTRRLRRTDNLIADLDCAYADLMDWAARRR